MLLANGLVHQALQTKQLLPQVHLVDAGYVDIDLFIDSVKRDDIDLVGPMRPNGSWQTKQPEAYALSQFEINWRTHRVTCPQGQKSKSWTKKQDP